MMKMSNARKYFIERCEEKIQMFEEMPSANKVRVKYFEAAKALLPVLPIASNEWITKHDQAESTLIQMHEDVEG